MSFIFIVYDIRKLKSKSTVIDYVQGVHLILCFFPRIFKTLQPLPRQYWAVIGRSENGQPIGVTVHSYESLPLEIILFRIHRVVWRAFNSIYFLFIYCI